MLNSLTIDTSEAKKEKSTKELLFTCDRNELKTKLSRVKGLLPEKPITDYQKTLLMKLRNNILYLTVFDGINLLSVNLVVKQSAENNSFLIPGQLISDLVDRMEESELEFALNSKNQKIEVKEKSQKTSYKLPIYPSEQYPQIPSELNSQNSIKVNSAELFLGIKSVLPFVSTLDTMMILCGVCFRTTVDQESGTKYLELAASDGKNLGIFQKIPIESSNKENKNEIDLVLPTRGMRELIKGLTTKEEKEKKNQKLIQENNENDNSDTDDIEITEESLGKTVTISTENGLVEIKSDTDEFRFLSRIIDGGNGVKFIPYQILIPKTFQTVISVNRKNLLKSLNRLSILVPETQKSSGVFIDISLDPKTNKMVLTYQEQTGEGTEEISITHSNTENQADKSLLLNTKRTTDNIKNIPGESILILLNEPDRPIMFKSADSKYHNLIQIIAPSIKR